ncbi:MAG: HflK protein, partial [Lutimaribacter sp.]
MAGQSGGPWGGGGNRGDENDGRREQGGGRRPGQQEGPQIPEIDELGRKGQEQLRVLMGGRGGAG